MIPQEAANDTLETTLADVQSLIKHCMKLKEADSKTLRLLDEIARPGSHCQASSTTKTPFPPMSAQEPTPSPLSGTSTLEIPPPREHWKALSMAGNSKKRKVGDEDMDGAVVVKTPKLPSLPQEPLKKKRKLISDAPTIIIDVKLKALPSVAPDKAGLPGDDQGFRDSDIRNGAQMIVLLLHSRTRIQKSCMISPVILNIAEEVEQQPGLLADVPIKMLAINSTSQWPEWGDQFAPTNCTNPEPTARDILQGIQDLSRRFDLLATNE
ncbi:hypothetical protein BDR06DRAFT_968999 [Suillus hirtellus]|nr:hypothetical protein BDR06DRAFT_968999 [Suillus hirtellus]